METSRAEIVENRQGVVCRRAPLNGGVNLDWDRNNIGYDERREGDHQREPDLVAANLDDRRSKGRSLSEVAVRHDVSNSVQIGQDHSFIEAECNSERLYVSFGQRDACAGVFTRCVAIRLVARWQLHDDKYRH